jgi:hypothetical protein
MHYCWMLSQLVLNGIQCIDVARFRSKACSCNSVWTRNAGVMQCSTSWSQPHGSNTFSAHCTAAGICNICCCACALSWGRPARVGGSICQRICMRTFSAVQQHYLRVHDICALGNVLNSCGVWEDAGWALGVELRWRQHQRVWQDAVSAE